MKAKDLSSLLFLSALWGGSFLFIRVAAPLLGPIVLMELRVLIAGLALLIYARATRTRLEIKKRWRQYLVIGLVNSALPFSLIATAELNLTAGFAAILNATTPLFGAIIAAIWIKDKLTPQKLIGLFLGLVGVSIIVGWSPLSFTSVLLLSVAASLAGALSYGFAAVYTKVSSQGISALAISTGSQLAASLWLLPFVPFTLPSAEISLAVWLAVVVLALACTALAYLIYFGLIKRIGPVRASTVTFLSPVFGILWGTLFLSEPLTFSTLLGFAVILSGTGLVTGLSFRKQTVLVETPKKVELA